MIKDACKLNETCAKMIINLIKLYFSIFNTKCYYKLRYLDIDILY